MLCALRIENFAIVKHLELDLSDGMTVFTGETGAGKSIMIDALMLALGGRGDASVVRPGEEKCDITAVFDITADSEPAQWLKDQDIEADNTLILRRVLYAEGRSKSTINGQPFPLQKVKELSEMLVHIHGQHQHQTLMQHQTHRQQLDQYAGHVSALQAVQNSYKNCQKIKKECELLQQQEKNPDRLALLRFQMEELQQLNLQDLSIDTLQNEHQHLHHAQDYLHKTTQLGQWLREEDSSNICQQLNQVLQTLNELPQQDKRIQNARDMIHSALIQCEEAMDEIEQFAEKVQLDPQRLNQIEDRLTSLHHMARKYHVELRDLAAHEQALTTEFMSLQERDKRIAELQAIYEEQQAVYQQAARKLRESRQQAARALATEISQIIQQLGMPKGFVTLEITELDTMQSHGLDKVEYKVCTNPGMLPDSLSKVASGGELSRISLAIQMITARKGATPTLLFDEVDVGIGGATAALVGQLLRKLGERLQIFCVTHQAQVAASAQHHFVVEKYTEEQHTFSRIIALQDQSKTDEIARMLGGLTITEQTRSHARELLEQCH